MALVVSLSTGALAVNSNLVGKTVCVSFFSSPEGFPSKPEKATNKVCEVFKGPETVLQIDTKGFAVGALSLFVDANANGKLDTAWYGKPLEPIAFSNNPRIKFKAPSFQDCKVSILPETKVKLELLSL